MKSLNFIILSFLFLLACNSPNSTPQTVETPAANLGGYTVTNIVGNEIQTATKVDENGTLIERGEVINGKRNGAWVTYYKDTKRIATLTNYVDGKKHGIFLKLNNRGQIEQEAHYNMDQLDGRWATYKFGSRPLKEATYVNGQIDGYYREYHDNGKVQKSVEYKDGKMHGRFIQYSAEGNALMKYEYENGEKVSGGIVKE